MPNKRGERRIEIREPKLVTHSQVYRFQVFYLEDGKLTSIEVTADTPGEAWGIIQKAGFQVKQVGTGIPILEPYREIFDRTSGAALVGYEPSMIDSWVASGALVPKRHDVPGWPRWTKQQLTTAALHCMQKERAA